jgi:pyrimidine nucleoside transport protein
LGITFHENSVSPFREDATVLEAAASGASAALPVVLGVIANLIAFVSFIAFANAIFEYFGGLVGIEGLTLEFIFGKIFTPLAWSMGVDWAECEYVGQLIGLKSVVNEFVAFERLGRFKEQGLINVSKWGIWFMEHF